MKKKNTTREKEKKVKAHLVTHSWISLSARASRASVCVCVCLGGLDFRIGRRFVRYRGAGPALFFAEKKKSVFFIILTTKTAKGGTLLLIRLRNSFEP